MTSKKTELFEEATRLSKRKQLEYCLPHLFSFKPYQWTLDYWKSTNRMKILVAGNQGSKSSSQIRHFIDLATEPKKWDEFFPRAKPRTFWYIYPDWPTVLEETKSKWEPEFMPRGMMKNHERYGWKPITHRHNFVGYEFNSGVRIYFKTWRSDFQSSTVDAVGIDEEIPFKLYDELSQRLNVRNGMMSVAFTATIGQKEWYDTMELRGKKGELFPDAFKRQISLEYDCKYYADGTPSPFTDEEISRRKAKCSSEREVNRRIHGKFVSDEGLAFPSFNRNLNVRAKTKVDRTWLFYGGVDIGTGGRDGHPAAISITAVRPDFKYGKLHNFWKGNKHENTTTTDILNKYIDMTSGINMTGNFYDWHSKEFFLRAQAGSVPFRQADKARDFGFDLMNTLFRNNMYHIEEGEHTEHLVYELENLKLSAKKTRAEDDGIDSLRYSLSSVAWNFDHVTSEMIFPVDEKPEVRKSSRHANPRKDSDADDEWSFEDDIEEYNELLGGY